MARDDPRVPATAEPSRLRDPDFSVPGRGQRPHAGLAHPRRPAGRRALPQAPKGPQAVQATSLPPQARALLATIGGPGFESNGSYTQRFNQPDLTDFSKHPGTFGAITRGPNAGLKSNAAGRYQFLSTTFADQAKKQGLTDFSPQSQDKAAWGLAQEAYRAKYPGPRPRDRLAEPRLAAAHRPGASQHLDLAPRRHGAGRKPGQVLLGLHEQPQDRGRQRPGDARARLSRPAASGRPAQADDHHARPGRRRRPPIPDDLQPGGAGLTWPTRSRRSSTSGCARPGSKKCRSTSTCASPTGSPRLTACAPCSPPPPGRRNGSRRTRANLNQSFAFECCGDFPTVIANTFMPEAREWVVRKAPVGSPPPLKEDAAEAKAKEGTSLIFEAHRGQ